MAEATPFHLQGNFATVQDEVSAENLEVEGSVPSELSGLYLRNGANPVTGYSEHWFLGQGMVHGVRLEGGAASWYRNRYVRTPFLDNPDIQRISAEGEVDHEASAANTHVISHHGKILALEEGSFPCELDDGLETVGFTDFGGKLNSAFTAHPKICPVTGEMLAFGYSWKPPYLVYHRVSPEGELVQSEEITVPGPTMMHDFMVTEKHALFLDLPVVFDIEAAMAGTMPFRWSDDYGARVGIMPRTGTNADVRWFEVEPCYVFHGMNAWDEDDRVVFDACRMSEIWREAGDLSGGAGQSSLHRFAFDLSSGTVKEETLDERGMEFPRIADARVGQKNRFGYAVALGEASDAGLGFGGYYKVDHATGKVEMRELGDGIGVAEAVFAPAAGSDPDSDEGWLMSYIYDESSGKSELQIVDATNFTGAPVARIKLPQRVPFGFHGSWVPDPA
ncbi:MAG: carotenoid oxygenase family protein [Myxococcota bacterium]|nr:carotenoid oxygenase family protein [Myxococcota bacterium]